MTILREIFGVPVQHDSQDMSQHIKSEVIAEHREEVDFLLKGTKFCGAEEMLQVDFRFVFGCKVDQRQGDCMLGT